MIIKEESLVQHHEKVVVKNDDIFRTWADLPSDILCTVFSLLFEFDHLSFRLTCKAWQQSSVRCPSISSSSSIQKFPWIMSYAKPQSHGVFSFFNPISNLTYVMKIPELAGAYFRCSRFGWLLMSRTPHSLFFYNPFIPGSTINIPDFRYAEFISMSFTAPPTSPDCIVFGHKWGPPNRVAIHRWGYGEDKWTEYLIDWQAPFYTTLCTPFFYKGVFYHLDINGRLGVLDPNNNHQKLTWNDLTQPIARKDIIAGYRYHIKNYVAECDGQLVLVFVCDKGDPIHVFELDWSQMEWVTLQSLGNKAMFIGETGSLLIKTSGSGEENKIYFPRFINTKGYGKSTDVGNSVFYCLETCKYHAFESKFPREDWLVTRGLSKFIWFEPNFECADWFRFLEVLRGPQQEDPVVSDHNDDDKEDDDDEEEEEEEEENDDDDDDEEEEEEEEEQEEEEDEDENEGEEEDEPASSVFVPTTDCPYLVFRHGKRNSRQTFFSILEEKYWVTSVVPEMSGMSCCASSHGWLVMLDNYSTRCFLLNPVSMEKVELPPMKMTSSYRKADHCVLTSSPSDNNNCVVMFVSKEHVACLFCRPNDQKWTRKSLGSKSKYKSLAGCAVVSSKGKIYISFLYGARIKVLDTTIDEDDTRNNSSTTAFKVKTIIIDDKKQPMEQGSSFAPAAFSNDLIESCGEVFLVVKIYWGGRGGNLSVYSVEVYKLIISNNNCTKHTTWEMVESLGDDRVFFLGKGCSSLSFSASKIGTKENCIFFFEPQDECVYTYNMEDQSISIDQPCPHIVCPAIQPYWMLPSVV